MKVYFHATGKTVKSVSFTNRARADKWFYRLVSMGKKYEARGMAINVGIHPC